MLFRQWKNEDSCETNGCKTFAQSFFCQEKKFSRIALSDCCKGFCRNKNFPGNDFWKALTVDAWTRFFRFHKFFWTKLSCSTTFGLLLGQFQPSRMKLWEKASKTRKVDKEKIGTTRIFFQRGKLILIFEMKTFSLRDCEVQSFKGCSLTRKPRETCFSPCHLGFHVFLLYSSFQIFRQTLSFAKVSKHDEQTWIVDFLQLSEKTHACWLSLRREVYQSVYPLIDCWGNPSCKLFLVLSQIFGKMKAHIGEEFATEKYVTSLGRKH